MTGKYQAVRTTTETWCGGKMIKKTQTEWRIEPISHKIKITGDPNLINKSIRCPCCGITIKEKV